MPPPLLLMTARTLPITARIRGRDVSRDEVLTWEAKRAEKVARRLGIAAAGADAQTLSRRIVDRKLELGHDRIERLVKRDVRVSGLVSRFGAAVSRGHRAVATTVLTCPTGRAEHLPEWYSEHFAANDERLMLAASPDHWLFRARTDGRDEVCEVAAASPFVIQMFFDDSDISTVRTPTDTSFPVDLAAIARTDNGTPIGGIRHLFRDETDGFRVQLNVEFPVIMLPYAITWHCWHLASEFSNWIEFANEIRDPAATP